MILFEYPESPAVSEEHIEHEKKTMNACKLLLLPKKRESSGKLFLFREPVTQIERAFHGYLL